MPNDYFVATREELDDRFHRMVNAGWDAREELYPEVYSRPEFRPIGTIRILAYRGTVQFYQLNALGAWILQMSASRETAGDLNRFLECGIAEIRGEDDGC